MSKRFPTQEELTEFVNMNVYICQSSLVEECLKKEIFSTEDIVNEYDSSEDEGEPKYQEVLEWWVVGGWLLDKLEEKGEPVLRTGFGDWWGRCCSGQSIMLDSVIADIYKTS